MKKVMVSSLVIEKSIGIPFLVEKGVALFHAFGVDYEEFENGPSNYSTAIVEWDDGTLENVRVNHIRFIIPNSTCADRLTK